MPILKATFFWVVAIACCSCATQKPPVPPPSREISQASTAKQVVADGSVQPEKRAATPGKSTRQPESPGLAVSPTVTPAARAPGIASLITQGTVESSTPSGIVIKSRQQRADPGLYEDAIILNRVRAALKATPQGNGIADGARIASGKVSLALPKALSAQDGADLIDLVLKAPGVEGVSAKFQ